MIYLVIFTFIGFITGFIIYIVSSIIMLILLYLVALCNKDVMNLFRTTSNISIDSIKITLYIVIIIYIIYSIVLYIIGKKKLEQGVNVD